METYKLIIFDTDGTLVEPRSGSTFRKSASDWKWLPGRIERLTALKVQGVQLAIATNQGGVAFGFMRQKDILTELTRMLQEGGFSKAALYVCYNHPKATVPEFKAVDNRRKPGPGMLQDAMRDFDAEPEETLMVGDCDEDQKAAQQAGCHFMWADEFFGAWYA